jgi:FMN phosphatase YigB (HAD superfamily)
MNKIKTIGIDFDLTLVDTAFGAEGWFDYLNKMSKNKLDKQKFLEYHSLGNGKIDYANLIDYNLSVYFPDLSEQETMSFWSDERLYQKIKPYPEAVEVINKLAKDGYNRN